MLHRAPLSFAVIWMCGVVCPQLVCGQSNPEFVRRTSDVPTAGVLTQIGSSQSGTFSNVIKVERASILCIHKVQVSAQADGLIEELLADEGSVVKKGDVLLTIDSRVAEAELAVAKKESVAARKTAEQTANVDYARAAAEVSREEYEAERELWTKRATTDSVLKRKQLEAQRAVFGVDVAVVEHENNGLAADVADEKVRAAKVRLDLYKVLAPYDGVIVQRLRDKGEWTRSGDPIMRLVSLNEMKVEAFVPVEGISLSQLVNAPMTITAKISADYDFVEETVVDFVSPEIDAGMVRVSGKVSNKRLGEGPWILRDGMSAMVQIQLK